MRQLPYSQEAEVALLGTLLIYPEAVNSMGEYHLRPDDFFIPANRIIFEHMSAVIDSGRLLDGNTLTTRLRDHNVYDEVGGSDALFNLAQNSSTPSSLSHYVDVVQEKAQVRRLIHVGQSITEQGFDTSVQLNALLDMAEKSIHEVTRIRRTEDMLPSSQVVSEFMKNLDDIRNNQNTMTGMATGFKRLDYTTNGLQKGDLIILAARPSVGKTAFALNLAINVAKRNKKAQAGAAIFSLEMPATHLMSRMLSAESDVHSQYLRTGDLNDERLNKLNTAALEMSQLNVFIDDSSTITVPEIFSKCRKLKNDGTLDIIIIDYIQLITGAGHSDSRQQEVSEISRGLKQLAREMEVPVIALSQLSRLVERRESKVPQLSDLRESGSIEQDADIVMFLYREDYYADREGDDLGQEKEKPEFTEVVVKISKHRQGALDDIVLQFNASKSKFYNTEHNEGRFQ